eukprot:c11947_g1_i1.p1 GENE.c11947_g1_i1~~c11947_g1_i1.p1  ORF type:complete len:126 (+),score=12.86 c11947_g1_i1:102-479(+)
MAVADGKRLYENIRTAVERAPDHALVVVSESDDQLVEIQLSQKHCIFGPGLSAPVHDVLFGGTVKIHVHPTNLTYLRIGAPSEPATLGTVEIFEKSVKTASGVLKLIPRDEVTVTSAPPMRPNFN